MRTSVGEEERQKEGTQETRASMGQQGDSKQGPNYMRYKEDYETRASLGQEDEKKGQNRRREKKTRTTSSHRRGQGRRNEHPRVRSTALFLLRLVLPQRESARQVK